MTLSREQMRAAILEHLEAENANDPARVVATSQPAESRAAV